MIHNKETFNIQIMKKIFLLIKILIIYLFLISNAIAKQQDYLNKGHRTFSKKRI